MRSSRKDPSVASRAIALVDGEHYPPVVIEAIDMLEERGFRVVAAAMLDGGEKLSHALDLGATPVVCGANPVEVVERAIAEHAPEVAVDVSDAPVLCGQERLRLAAICLARGVAYRGADFAFDPPPRPRLAGRPTLAVIGSGKRCGKTAISGYIARTLCEEGLRPVIVAMGRGGPERPRLVRGDEHRPTAEELLAVAEGGEHAAGDIYEDAVMAGVPVVGARRAGAGMAGTPVVDNVADAIEMANLLPADLIILEGSGTAIPPAAADATILVAGATGRLDALEGLGVFRILLADLVVATMLHEKSVSAQTLSALPSFIREQATGVAYVGTAFRPTPVEPVAGRRILVATTAPAQVGDALRAHLQDVHGAMVVGVTHNLADREALVEDLTAKAGTYEVLVSELKAAAVDVAVRYAVAVGAEVVFMENRPVPVEGDLKGEVLRVTKVATERFENSGRSARRAAT